MSVRLFLCHTPLLPISLNISSLSQFFTVLHLKASFTLPLLWWPTCANALQIKKTHANRQNTSKLRKHHQFDNSCAAFSKHAANTQTRCQNESMQTKNAAVHKRVAKTKARKTKTLHPVFNGSSSVLSFLQRVYVFTSRFYVFGCVWCICSEFAECSA